MKRIAVLGLVVVVLLGGAGILCRDEIRLWLLTRQIESSDEGRHESAIITIAGMDAKGFPTLTELLTLDRPDLCEMVSHALRERIESWPPEDPRFRTLYAQLLARIQQFSTPGRHATLVLLPKLLNDCTPEQVSAARPLIVAALSDPDHRIREQAVELAQRGDINALEEVLPLLRDATPEVRRRAMLAVGPSRPDREALIETEALLPWLHDPDQTVRRHCEIALQTRGLSEAEIKLSRQITDPRPVERLRVLLELPDEEEFPITPWLERLSRDPDSAVRAGAARVAVERRASLDERLQEMLLSDPDLSVRQIVEHYSKRKK